MNYFCRSNSSTFKGKYPGRFDIILFTRYSIFTLQCTYPSVKNGIFNRTNLFFISNLINKPAEKRNQRILILEPRKHILKKNHWSKYLLILEKKQNNWAKCLILFNTINSLNLLSSVGYINKTPLIFLFC